MRIRNKAVIIFSTTILIIIIGAYFIIHVFFLDQLKLEEENLVSVDVKRAELLLDQNLSKLNATSADWAQWDDTLQFVKDQNRGYIDSNFNSSTFSNIEVDAFVFLDNNLNIIYSTGYNSNTKQVEGVSGSLLSYIKKNQNTICNHKDLDSVVAGIVLLDKGPMLISSRPITNSTMTAPKSGTLIACRYVDDEMIKKIEEVLLSKVRILNSNEQQEIVEKFRNNKLKFDEIINNNATVILPVNSNEMAGYSAIKDISNKSDYLLEVVKDRKIYKNGIFASNFFTIVLTSFILLVFLICIVFIQLIVISPLEKLNNSISNIDPINISFDANKYRGKGEIANLAGEIGNMLNRLKESEKKYWTIFNFAVDAIVVIDFDGNVIDCNKAVTKILGIDSKNGLIGRKVFDYLNEKDKMRALKDFGRISKSQEILNVEYPISNISGDSLLLEISASIVKNTLNEPLYVVIIAKDITERKAIQEALIESEAKYKSLFNNMALGCAHYKAINEKSGKPGNFSIMEVNTAYERIVGLTKNTIVGKKATEIHLWPKNLDGQVLEVMKKVALLHNPISIEIQSSIDKNKWYFILFYYVKKGYIACTYSDITEQKLAEINLKKSIEISEEANRAKNEFLANVSHELRTPVNVIYCTVQLLNSCFTQNKPVDCGKLEKHIKSIRQNCLRLIRLVNNVIDTTKIDSGFFEVHLKNINIVYLIEEIALSVSEYIKGNGLELYFDTDCEEKIMAVDPDKIEKIMLNLLSNAVKFTKKGGAIYINIYDKGDSVVISAKDTGIGIEEDKKEIIFEKFKQAGNLLTRSNEGSGIGLSMVKSFVEMHGGNIRLESKINEGSEFIIEIPVKTIQEAVCEIDGYTHTNCLERINVEFSDIYL